MSLKNPVKYPAHYYNWKDKGAPQLDDIDGCIKTIIKAGCVTGYGDKASAGWEMPFEDDYRMVLRRPLRTGNPPDLKIENGTIEIDGKDTPRHRIVSYEMDSCTGLDDTNELASANILTRDNKHGQEWHLIVTDFAFLLCYQMSENGYNGGKNNALYVGSMQNMRNDGSDIHLVSLDKKIKENGTGQLYLNTLLDGSVFVDMLTAAELSNNHKLDVDVDELYYNNDYVAQKIVVGNDLIAPFYCSLSTQLDDLTSKYIDIDSRPMLRYVNKAFGMGGRVLYIPLDFWTL